MRWRQRLLSLVVAFSVAGCGDKAVGPEDIVGQYHATTFEIIINGVKSELLSKGASVDLQLKADMTTAGRILMPAVSGVQLTPIDHDLAGTYTNGSGIVHLNQAADSSYLDGMIFTAAPPELRAFIVLSDPTRIGSFTLVLTRQ